MPTTDAFRDAIQKLNAQGQERDRQVAYMSDMNNWLCVHATKYMPGRGPDGKLNIQTTAMATGYSFPRQTVHFTLNHVVASHFGGDWDAAPFVILCPFNDIVRANGNPSEVSTMDTYFVANPETGIVLSDNAYIVKPDNSVLYSIGDHGATYKTDNFSPQEMETIVSLMTPSERREYEKYSTGNITELDIENMGEKVYTAYQNSKDKRAFLRGMYAEEKFTMLSKFLRNAVVRMAMDKMGYEYVDVYDCDEVSQSVAETAWQNGIHGNQSNKGHSGSCEYVLEDVGLKWKWFIDALALADMDEMLTWCRPQLDYYLAHDGVPDIYGEYVKEYNDWAKLVERDNYHPKKTISEYNKHLDDTLRRSANVLQQEYIAADKKFRASDMYQQLQQWLKRTRAAARSQNADAAIVATKQSVRD